MKVCNHLFRKTLLNPSALLVTSHYELCRKDSLCELACMFCINREGEIGGCVWGHLQAAVHMVATI